MLPSCDSVEVVQYLQPNHIGWARQEEQAPYKRGWWAYTVRGTSWAGMDKSRLPVNRKICFYVLGTIMLFMVESCQVVSSTHLLQRLLYGFCRHSS